MALCSIILSVTMLLPIGDNIFSKLDGDVINDDLISVSCPRQDSCLVLDKAGNIWFSSDMGKTLSLRASLPAIGLSKIRMSGLLDGWALDSRGRIWKTRDGARSFNLLKGPMALATSEKVTFLAIHKTVPWLGTSSGAVYTLVKRKIFKRLLHTNTGPIISIALGPDASVSTLSESGWLHHWKEPGMQAVKTRPSVKSPVALLDNGNILMISGCSNSIAMSMDGAKTWKKKKLGILVGCLKPLLAASDRTVIVGGLAGTLILVEKNGESFRKLDANPKRIWRDAAKCGKAFLLVGDGGARGWLNATVKSGWKWISLGKTFEAVGSLGGVSPEGAMVCFNDGKILLTERFDKNKKWHRISKVPHGPAKAIFIDRKIGFALSGVHDIMRTNDGGATWMSVGNWPDLSLRDLFFLDRNRGWAVGGSGALVRTTNGGRSWTLSRMPGYDRVLYRVLFVNKAIGYVVGAKRGIFKSTDGGKNWKRLASGKDNLRALFFSGKNRGWVGGDAGLILRTSDGGKTWMTSALPSPEPVRALWFIDDQRGLAGSGLGGLWATVDGENTWTKIELNTKAGVTKIFCKKKLKKCLVGGQRGLLLSGYPFDSLLP